MGSGEGEGGAPGLEPEAGSTWAGLQEGLQQQSCRKALLRRPLTGAGNWEVKASQD